MVLLPVTRTTRRLSHWITENAGVFWDKKSPMCPCYPKLLRNVKLGWSYVRTNMPYRLHAPPSRTLEKTDGHSDYRMNGHLAQLRLVLLDRLQLTVVFMAIVVLDVKDPFIPNRKQQRLGRFSTFPQSRSTP